MRSPACAALVELGVGAGVTASASNPISLIVARYGNSLLHAGRSAAPWRSRTRTCRARATVTAPRPAGLASRRPSRRQHPSRSIAGGTTSRRDGEHLDDPRRAGDVDAQRAGAGRVERRPRGRRPLAAEVLGRSSTTSSTRSPGRRRSRSPRRSSFSVPSPSGSYARPTRSTRRPAPRRRRRRASAVGRRGRVGVGRRRSCRRSPVVVATERVPQQHRRRRARRASRPPTRISDGLRRCSNWRFGRCWTRLRPVGVRSRPRARGRRPAARRCARAGSRRPRCGGAARACAAARSIGGSAACGTPLRAACVRVAACGRRRRGRVVVGVGSWARSRPRSSAAFTAAPVGEAVVGSAGEQLVDHRGEAVRAASGAAG